ncbi:MAG: hypothetical protein ACKOTD_05635, partial [Phycisphaerales bacterium]
MRFRPPAGSVLRADGQGPNAVWFVSERSETPRVILRVTRLVASEATSSPTAQIDALIKSVSERPAPDLVFAVLDREEFNLGERPAASLYTSLREGSGEDEVSAVQGYFMVQIAPNEFIVISSLVAEQDFRAVRPLLDRSFRTMEIEAPGVVAAARDARVQRGAALLASLDEAALRKALDAPGPNGAAPAPHWFRMTRTLSDGTVREEGYMTLLAVEAEQGAANPDRSPKEWTAEEREKGLAVRVQVRLLGDERGTAFVDTDARYWMRWDRGREFWTVRTTARSGKTSKTSSQLGIRTEPSAGMPRPTLQVATVNLDVPAEEPKRWNIPTAYLSQAEALPLPQPEQRLRLDLLDLGAVVGGTALDLPVRVAPLLEERRLERRTRLEHEAGARRAHAVHALRHASAARIEPVEAEVDRRIGAGQQPRQQQRLRLREVGGGDVPALGFLGRDVEVHR